MEFLGVVLFVVLVTVVLSVIGKFKKPRQRKKRWDDATRQYNEDMYWAERENEVPVVVSADDGYDDGGGGDD